MDARSQVLSQRDRVQLLHNQRLAEQLGATVVTLSGENAPDEVIRFAREHNVTRIVLGKPRFASWKDRFFGSFVDRIVLSSGEIDVYVTAGPDEERIPEPAIYPAKSSDPMGYAFGTAIVACASLTGWLAFGHSAPADVVMLYLLGVMLVSMRCDHGPSLLARIRAALRRKDRLATGASDAVFTLGELRVDLASRQVQVGRRGVHLTPTEYNLLATLARHAGKVVTHRQLLQEVWGQAYTSQTQYLRVYMGQLRHKLEPEPARPRYILTELGVGYRLMVE